MKALRLDPVDLARTANGFLEKMVNQVVAITVQMVNGCLARVEVGQGDKQVAVIMVLTVNGSLGQEVEVQGHSKEVEGTMRRMGAGYRVQVVAVLEAKAADRAVVGTMRRMAAGYRVQVVVVLEAKEAARAVVGTTHRMVAGYQVQVVQAHLDKAVGTMVPMVSGYLDPAGLDLLHSRVLGTTVLMESGYKGHQGLTKYQAVIITPMENGCLAQAAEARQRVREAGTTHLTGSGIPVQEDLVPMANPDTKAQMVNGFPVLEVDSKGRVRDLVGKAEDTLEPTVTGCQVRMAQVRLVRIKFLVATTERTANGFLVQAEEANPTVRVAVTTLQTESGWLGQAVWVQMVDLGNMVQMVNGYHQAGQEEVKLEEEECQVKAGMSVQTEDGYQDP